jgi:HAD superfamily hydrolase (TIGR01490 family)
VSDSTSVASPERQNRIAAFFDLDKTIIAKSSVMAFSKQFLEEGLMTRRSLIKGAYAQLMLAMSTADADKAEQLRKYLSSLVTGWDVATVDRIVADAMATAVRPIIYAEALQLINEHRAKGHTVVIISASGREVAEPIGRMLGADRIIATEMAVVDGRYTGEITRYVYGEAKAEAVRAEAEAQGFDLALSYAYGDSSKDVPMLETVGNPYVVNPSTELRRVAEERGWPALSFRLTVDPRDSGSTARTLGMVAAGAATAAGVSWWLLRRAR